MLEEKREIYSLFLKERKPKFEKHDFVDKGLWNNAKLLSVSLYSPDYKAFDRSFNCFSKGRIIEYLDALREEIEERGANPAALLNELCTFRKREV